MDECLLPPGVPVLLGLFGAAAGDMEQALMAWPCPEPVDPLGFQHCYLSSVYRQRSGVSWPKVKDSTALNHITGQKGEMTSPWDCWHSKALTPCPQRKYGSRRGFLWKIWLGLDRGWCHCLLQQMLARRSPNVGSTPLLQGQGRTVPPLIPAPVFLIYHRRDSQPRD